LVTISVDYGIASEGEWQKTGHGLIASYGGKMNATELDRIITKDE